MKDQKFDKIIGDKLRNIEAEPALGSFQKIMSGRSPKAFFNQTIIKTWVLITASVILVSSWIITHNNFNNTTPEIAEVETITNQSTTSSGKSETSNHIVNKEETVVANSQQASNVSVSVSVSTQNKVTFKEKQDRSKAERTKSYSDKSPSTIDSKELADKNNVSSDSDVPAIEQPTRNFGKPVLSEMINMSHRNFEGLLHVESVGLIYDMNTASISNKEKFKPSKRLKEIEIFYGMGIWNSNHFGQEMDNRLTSQYFSEAGLRFRLPVAKNINFITGIQVSKWQSNFNHSYTENSTLTHIDTFNGVIVDPFGIPQTITRHDTSYQDIVNQYSTNGKNTYTMINLPIGIEYSKSLKRGAVYGNLAALVRIQSNHNGHWISEDSKDPFEFNNHGYTSQLTGNIGLTGGIGYLHHINHKISIGIEPHFNIYTINEFPTQIKEQGNIWNLGIRTGLRYSF
jgi:hypothetical protein